MRTTLPKETEATATCARCGKARVAHEVKRHGSGTVTVTISQVVAAGRMDPGYFIGACEEFVAAEAAS